MPRSSLLLQHARQHQSQGFSLTEILVAAVLSSVTVVAAVQILGPHLRLNQRMEGYNRLQERWARTAYLLDTEIPNARSATGANNKLTLTVPARILPDSSASGDCTSVSTLASPNSAICTITYKQVGTRLLRDGPVVTSWGDLDTAKTLTDQLVLDGVIADSFVPTVNEASVKYKLDLWDPNSDATYPGRGSAARSKANCLSLEADATPPPCE